MTTTNPRTRRLGRRACAAALLTLLTLAGCKSKDGGGSSPAKSRDPLVRIPAQNVPIPGRDDAIGTKGTKSDPLLDKPVSRDRTGVGYTDDPERFKGTYVPGAGTTPAALSSKMKDGDALKIDAPDNRVPLRPAGGVVPGGGSDFPVVPGGGVDSGNGAGENPDGVEPLYTELAKYGAKADDRRLLREEGQWVFRALIPWKGAKREYTGVGKTPTEAVQELLDQVIMDRK